MTRVIVFKSPCPIAPENFSRALPDIHPAAGTRPLAKAKTRFCSTSGSRDSCSSSSPCSSELTAVPSARCDYPMLPDRGQETAAHEWGLVSLTRATSRSHASSQGFDAKRSWFVWSISSVWAVSLAGPARFAQRPDEPYGPDRPDRPERPMTLSPL